MREGLVANRGGEKERVGMRERVEFDGRNKREIRRREKEKDTEESKKKSEKERKRGEKSAAKQNRRTETK